MEKENRKERKREIRKGRKKRKKGGRKEREKEKGEELVGLGFREEWWKKERKGGGLGFGEKEMGK